MPGKNSNGASIHQTRNLDLYTIRFIWVMVLHMVRKTAAKSTW